MSPLLEGLNIILQRVTLNPPNIPIMSRALGELSWREELRQDKLSVICALSKDIVLGGVKESEKEIFRLLKEYNSSVNICPAKNESRFDLDPDQKSRDNKLKTTYISDLGSLDFLLVSGARYGSYIIHLVIHPISIEPQRRPLIGDTASKQD
ncbi:hypothetical protein H2248_004078 [Termitomyces sp. 'cryptogamus']|nr:hypothetical protein H2248_004078 [Termitomyces sp. 'cryptogamus']